MILCTTSVEFSSSFIPPDLTQVLTQYSKAKQAVGALVADVDNVKSKIFAQAVSFSIITAILGSIYIIFFILAFFKISDIPLMNISFPKTLKVFFLICGLVALLSFVIITIFSWVSYSKVCEVVKTISATETVVSDEFNKDIESVREQLEFIVKEMFTLFQLEMLQTQQEREKQEYYETISSFQETLSKINVDLLDKTKDTFETVLLTLESISSSLFFIDFQTPVRQDSEDATQYLLSYKRKIEELLTMLNEIFGQGNFISNLSQLEKLIVESKKRELVDRTTVSTYLLLLQNITLDLVEDIKAKTADFLIAQKESEKISESITNKEIELYNIITGKNSLAKGILYGAPEAKNVSREERFAVIQKVQVAFGAGLFTCNFVHKMTNKAGVALKLPIDVADFLKVLDNILQGNKIIAGLATEKA